MKVMYVHTLGMHNYCIVLYPHIASDSWLGVRSGILMVEVYGGKMGMDGCGCVT